MKIAAAALLALPIVGAFAPTSLRSAWSSSTSRLAMSAVVTGPTGKAAVSAAEDLALTLQIIMDHQDRSTTVSKEQFIQQMEESVKVEKVSAKTEVVDISVPYDSAAQLAYDASDKSKSFDDFKVQYLADAVALVKSKQPIDVSIPYNAAAKNAYAASDKSASFAIFETQYIADAVAMVKSKQPVDISVPYNAAAKNAYAASDKSASFAIFEKKYLADAVAMVKSKQPVDISIPYDATAKLAYAKSDKSTKYEDFKTQYLADAVADVKTKQKA